MPPVLVEGKILPPILHIQMDNHVKDKYRYVFYFLSLLVAKAISKEMCVSFSYGWAYTR
jgi:hypothetical protein